jgi:basic membrane protein A and related proteins
MLFTPWTRALRLGVLLAVAALAAAACSSGSGSATADPLPEPLPEPRSAGLVFDANGLGDLQFNDSAYKGLTEAREEFRDGLQITYKEPDNKSSNSAVLVDQMIAERVNLVIGVGFAFSESMPERAKKHPGTRFAIVDGFGCEAPNLRCIVFREHEGAFLMGVAAALKTRSNVVGLIGGTQIDVLLRVEAGFRAGVAWGAEQRGQDIRVLVDYVAPGQDVSGFTNPARGRQLASKQIGQGADVIMQGAGLSGLGVIAQVAEDRKLVIGVDSDQSLSASPEERKWILTSMLKRVDNAVLTSIEDYMAGRFNGGFQSFGLKERGLDYAINVYNRELLGDIPTTLDQIREQVISGQIKVPEKAAA